MRQKDTLKDVRLKEASQATEPRGAIRPDMIIVGLLVLLGISATGFKLASLLGG